MVCKPDANARQQEGTTPHFITTSVARSWCRLCAANGVSASCNIALVGSVESRNSAGHVDCLVPRMVSMSRSPIEATQYMEIHISELNLQATSPAQQE